MSKNKLMLGTTIVELTLYMGLLSIFIVIIFNLFSAILSAQTRSASVSLVQTNGNYLSTKLSLDINQATAIIVPAAINSTAPSFTLQVGTTTANYSVSNGRLVLTDSSGSYNLNDQDTTVSNFTSRRVGNSGGKPGLQISFTISSNLEDNSNQKTKDFQIFSNLR